MRRRLSADECRYAPGTALFTRWRLATWLPEAVKSWGPWLAERGYAVVAVDYRLSNQVSPAWPGVWEDVCRSLDWLIAKASSLQIDPARIGTIGDSVGGHMAAMLSLHERTAQHIRAMVGVYGIYDLPIGGA